MAHVFMGHHQKKQFNTALGTIGGTLVDGGLLLAGMSTGGEFGKQFGKAGAAAYSPAFESEADYVGAYYATRAGYDVAGAEEIWFAMGVNHPEGIRFTASHPATPIRFVQMKKVAEEIADKKRRGLPLVPELRSIEEPMMASTADAMR
jgi:predicted Zn-dependent protease